MDFLILAVDFWISVWISADGVQDFFRDGPLDGDSYQRTVHTVVWNLNLCFFF